MTTPRVYTVESAHFNLDDHKEVILLSDHKEVVRSLEQTISELKDHRNTSADILVETRALVQRQALAIEKLKLQRDIELARNSGEFMETIIENMNAEITAILQEAK